MSDKALHGVGAVTQSSYPKVKELIESQRWFKFVKQEKGVLLYYSIDPIITQKQIQGFIDALCHIVYQSSPTTARDNE